MKLHQIFESNEEVLSEGLIHFFGKILKYAAIFFGGAFLLRTARNIILDKNKEEEYQYYMVIGDVLQIRRSSEERLDDLLSVFSNEFKDMTNAISFQYDYKKISGKKYKDADESLGNFFNVNIILFYMSSSEINKAMKQVDIMNNKFDTRFELIKKGKV